MRKGFLGGTSEPRSRSADIKHTTEGVDQSRRLSDHSCGPQREGHDGPTQSIQLQECLELLKGPTDERRYGRTKALSNKCPETVDASQDVELYTHRNLTEHNILVKLHHVFSNTGLWGCSLSQSCYPLEMRTPSEPSSKL